MASNHTGGGFDALASRGAAARSHGARDVGDDQVLERPLIASAAGDPMKLRGLPVVGARGVGGAIPGTVPHNAVQ